MMRALKYLTMTACLLVLVAPAPAQQDVTQLASQLDSPDAKVRLDACLALTKLGAKARVAVPQLTKALKTEDVEVQRQAATALGAIGEGAAAAVPALVETLRSQDPKVRAYTAHALGEIGPAVRGAAAALIAALADEDATVRRLARDSLYDIKPGKDVALPLFVKMLNNSSQADAAAAVETLAEAGAQAVPILIEALNDKEASYWACLALSEIGPPAAAAVPKLGTMLESDEPETRMEALEALAAIGAASQPLVGKIAERLSKDDAQSVRYAAAHALGTIGDKESGSADSDPGAGRQG